MLIGIGAAILAAVAFGVASMLQAVGARGEPSTAGVDLLLLVRLLRQPAFVLAMLVSLCGFLLHLVALRHLPLYAVQPVIGSSVAVTALVSRLFGHGPLGPRGRVLVLTVCAGLALVTAAARSGAATHTSTGQRASLLLAVLAIAVAGWIAGRWQGPRAATLLSLLSGLGFAVVAISGRALPSLAVPAVLSDPASLALAGGGGIGFLFYSIALQRGTVISATAAMVVGNTVAPVLVGLAALGDRFRAGWAPAAVLGLLLAAASVILLEGVQAAPAQPQPQR